MTSIKTKANFTITQKWIDSLKSVSITITADEFNGLTVDEKDSTLLGFIEYTNGYGSGRHFKNDIAKLFRKLYKFQGII